MEPTIYEIAGKYLALYEGLYKEVDPHYKGIIKAPVAASFLKRSNLSNQLLGQIWEMADKGAKGYLDKENFFTALKLIACVQQGRELATSNLTIDIPAPVIASQAESPSLPAFGSLNQTEISDWIIKAKDQAKYDEIFHTLGPVNGKLSGEQVRPVLLNSGLPNEILGRIWELSDIDKDGYLDRDEMCVALHLVYRALESDPVPVALPHNMLPPSKRRPSMAGSQHSLSRKSSGLAGAIRVLPPQASLSRRSRASSVTSMDSVGMPGSDIQSPHTAARSLTGTPVPSMPIVKPPSPWIVDKYRWEKIFVGADLDKDGLVDGADVKQIFLQTGLAQAYLAHIWNLCDINSTGSLNLEQFALAMHFVEQKKQHNVEPPAELPPDLLPPSFRPNPAGMTDISTSTTIHETSLPATDSHFESSKSGNTKIDEVLDDIKNIQQEKRNFEQQLIQLEADMTIKNSEIRNLEVELNTLQATVKQLERQKGEAQRRLDDLDKQRNSLNEALNELIKRNEDDLQNINHMKSIIDDSDQVARENEKVLNEKRTLLKTLTDEEMSLESKLQNDRRTLQNLQRDQQECDDYALKADDIVQQLRKQREFLMEKLEKLEQVVANGDHNYLASNQDLMSMDDEFNLNKIIGYQFMSTSSSINAVIGSVESDEVQATFEDPFKSHDPFGNPIHDPFAEHDPFASAVPVEDPFASSDPFANQSSHLPGFVEHQSDPFASRNVPEVGGGAKKAPPRPAPPPGAAKQSAAASPIVNDPFSQQQQQQPWSAATAVADPFSSNNSGGASGGFGNFADFSKFS